MKRKTKFGHYIEAMLLKALPAALRPLPYAWRIRLGGAMVGGLIRLIPPLKHRITSNLSLIYPDMKKAEKKVFIQRNTKHIGRRFMELYYNKDFHARLKNITMPPDALAQIEAAQKAGQPVIMVSGHFGQWEAVRVVLARAGIASAAIYKESGNPIFERHFVAAMLDGGPDLFPVGASGTRKMVKHLRGGGIVSVLLDQRVGGGVALDFLGQPALSSTIMASLALKTGALMVPAYALVLPDGGTEISIELPIEHSDPVSMTKAVNDSLSARVRQNPEQWYWLHNRWARPDLKR